jgi:hypothetical protein
MCVVPMIGSPPMPMAVEKPKSLQLEHHLVGQRATTWRPGRWGRARMMLAGVMPDESFTGVMMPGQFGPMIRVFLPFSTL